MIHAATLAFIAGVVLMAWSPISLGWAFLGLSVLFVTMMWRWPAILFGALMGLVWCGLVAQSAMDNRWLSGAPQQVHMIEGHVLSLPRWSDDVLVFDFKPLADQDQWPGKIRVHWYRPKHYVVPGEVWQLPLRLSAPEGRLNFAGFDYEHYLIEHGIGAIGRIAADDPLGAPKLIDHVVSLPTFFNQSRLTIAENIQANTTRLDVAALKRALVIGDRAKLEEELDLLLRRTGTAHLLAISGLHIGLVASIGAAISAVFWWGLRLFGLCWSRRSVVLIGGFTVALFYVGLAGWSVPTQRAAIMLFVAMVAIMIRRRVQPFDAVLIAAVLVLLFNPLAALSVGFWLSFLAVFWLLWGFSWRTRWSTQPAVSVLFRAQWIMTIGLLPLSLGVFGWWSPNAFLANVVAIPWVGFAVLPGVMLSAALHELGWSVPWLSHWVDLSLVWLIQFLALLDQSLTWSIDINERPRWFMLLAVLGASATWVARTGVGGGDAGAHGIERHNKSR